MDISNADNTGQKTRILVVEDEADIQQVLCVFLRLSGFDVRGVFNGEAAMQAIEEFHPHVMLLDLMMHPISGWDVLNWLQKQHLTPPLRVLVLTARSQLTEQIQGFEGGAIEYILKPTQPSVLIERIKRIVAMTDEQQTMLRLENLNKKRQVLERLSAPQPDEFVY